MSFHGFCGYPFWIKPISSYIFYPGTGKKHRCWSSRRSASNYLDGCQCQNLVALNHTNSHPWHFVEQQKQYVPNGDVTWNYRKGLKIGNFIDSTPEQENILNPKSWRFGRWFPFSNRWFSGSKVIFSRVFAVFFLRFGLQSRPLDKDGCRWGSQFLPYTISANHQTARLPHEMWWFRPSMGILTPKMAKTIWVGKIFWYFGKLRRWYHSLVVSKFFFVVPLLGEMIQFDYYFLKFAETTKDSINIYTYICFFFITWFI